MIDVTSKKGMKLDFITRCPICNEFVEENLGEHIKRIHGEEAFQKAVLKAKEEGVSDPEIGSVFGISFNRLQKIITEVYGVNISILKSPKKLKSWTPKNYQNETTTVWSFRQRGNWATHDGRYRGNWSPYIPRNIILEYSKPGELVLDYFVGGGTTAVEAKLLGRRCIARDINPAALGLALENLKFSPPKKLFGENPVYEPDVSLGDARDLSGIANESVDLICAHPPYAGIINYSSKVEGDLSKLSIDGFLEEMKTVASESLRVLKPGGKCAILIGDTRKHKHVVPIGFRTIQVFLDAGFVLRELVIKRQHNCKTAGFWYKKSIKYNFLLLTHEYLPVFEKPKEQNSDKHSSHEGDTIEYLTKIRRVNKVRKEDLETSTVWIFPKEKMNEEIRRNLIARMGEPDRQYLEIKFNDTSSRTDYKTCISPSLVYVCSPENLDSEDDITSYLKGVEKLTEETSNTLADDGVFVIDTKDIRIDGLVHPLGVNLLTNTTIHDDFKIKEIVVVTPEKKRDLSEASNNQRLEIVHRYLLVFIKRKRGQAT